MEKISAAEKDLQLMMYARYGELGERMDGAVLAERAARILSSERMLKITVNRAVKDEVYGPFLTPESYLEALRRLVDAQSENRSVVVRFAGVEQAFQYAKTHFSSADAKELEPFRKGILSATDALSLRNLGRQVPGLDVRAWDAAKYGIMKDLIKESFLQNPDKAKAFVEKTDGFILTHEQDKSEWRELFPKVLMEVRDELKVALGLDKAPGETPERKPLKDYMEERFDFQIGSCRFFINDNFECDSYPKCEVNGIALRNTISDAIEAGYERIDIKDCILRNYKNLEMTVDQKRIYDRAFKELVDGKKISLNTAKEEHSVLSYFQKIFFTMSEGQYSKRTLENANADDVDYTFQFCLENRFDTPGERCTARAAGDSLVKVVLPVNAEGRLDLSDSAVAGCVKQITDMIEDEFVGGEPFGVNLAGNGSYTLGKVCDQETLDAFFQKLSWKMKAGGIALSGVRSGGQTGVDESAVVMGRTFNVPVIIHGPSDWAFRLPSGKDVRGDETAFRNRFDKDYGRIARIAKSIVRKEKQGVKRGI